MQQLIVGQVSGGEQPREDVQLTELLPVKQSRIRENNVFKDADATDALKALRSFSAGCNDEQEFGLRIFEVEKTDDRQEKQKVTRKRGSAGRKRTSDERREASRTEDSDEKDKSDLDHEENPNDAKRSRATGKRNALRAKKKAKKSWTSIKSDGKGDNARVKPIRKVIGDKGEQLRAGEGEELNDIEDELTYWDLDKNKDCLNDEVYVFRREPPDSNSLSGASTDVTSVNAEEYCENDYRTTDGTLFDTRNRRSASDDDEITNEELNSCGSQVNSAPGGEDNSEKELRLKIDAIIQANFLVEQENNNVFNRETQQKGERRIEKDNKGSKEDSCASSSSSSSSSLSSSSSSSSPRTTYTREGSFSEEDAKRSEEDGATNDEQSSQDCQKKYCCVVCDARFKGSGGLRNHYKVVHGAGPIFKCDECGKEFPLKERLKLHVRTHTGFKPYKCPECDKSFARGGQLVQHRRTHSQVKPYRCALCSGTFTCAANLALHVKRHNGQKDHKCEICGRGFVRRDALKKHLECLHRDVKSFLCVICNKTFKGHLPQHMRTHARDRPHGCATCGQRFAQKSQLTVHQRTHSGQRPFRCLVCWQAFAHSTALKLHTRRHTGERPFKCVECNAGFTQLPHWKKHMKCIHGRSEPYGCRRCKSFFRIKSDLESHEKTCHPDIEADGDASMSGNFASSNDGSVDRASNNPSKYRAMTVERMRLLLAVLLKRISKQERLDELGFGKRLIDEVLQDSLISAGKDPASGEGLSELETLTKNLETFLEWTVPKEHWENFRRMKKTPEDILETLTAT